MKSLRQQPTVLKEDLMKRPDLATLACVNPECQRFRRTGQDNLTVRKVYGQDTSGSCAAGRAARSAPSDAAPHCSIPRSQRNGQRPSSIIWAKGAECGPPPAWSTSPKTRSRACSGWRAAMPSGSMTAEYAPSRYAPWNVMTSGAS